MSVNVGTAYLEIIPSAKGFAGKLQGQVGGQMSRAGADAGSRYSKSLSSSALPGFRRVATAATGMFAAIGVGKIASFGLDIASQNEQAKISFTTMLGSAQKADKFIRNLQAFAAKTPFDFPGLQKSASSLISIGVKTKDVIPIMTTLGNVTSGMGTGAEGVQRATIAIQQMIASQRISGEDLNQLRDAGIPVYNLLAKATGKSAAEVVNLAQKGKLGKKELTQMLDALKSGKGLEKFDGLMDKQSQSLSGLASTFKDTFGQNLASAIQPLIPLIKDGMGKASQFLAEQMPKLSKGLADFIQNMQNGTGVAGKIRTVLEDFGTTVKVVFGFVRDNKTVVATFIGVLAGFSILNSIRNGFIALNAAMAANPIGLVVVALAALAAGLVFAYKHSETFRDIVNGAFKAVSTAASFMWDKVIKPIFKLWVNSWFTVIGAMVNGAAKAFGWVPGIGGKLKAAAAKFNDFRDSVNRALDGIKSVKEIRLNVTTRQSVLISSINKPRVGGIVGATGGIVTRPTLATIGEAGPEAVVPLNRTPGSSPLPAGFGGSSVDQEQAVYRGTSRALADSRLVVMPKDNLRDLDLLVGAG